jgi:hypothetical protein
VRKQQNIEAQQRFGDAVNSGKLEVILEVVSPSVIDHDPAPDQEPGPQGLVKLFAGLRRAFPDLNISVDQLVADEENVSIAYTISGTHTREDFWESRQAAKRSGREGYRLRALKRARWSRGGAARTSSASSNKSVGGRRGSWEAKQHETNAILLSSVHRPPNHPHTKRRTVYAV